MSSWNRLTIAPTEQDTPDGLTPVIHIYSEHICAHSASVNNRFTMLPRSAASHIDAFLLSMKGWYSKIGECTWIATAPRLGSSGQSHLREEWMIHVVQPTGEWRYG